MTASESDAASLSVPEYARAVCVLVDQPTRRRLLISIPIALLIVASEAVALFLLVQFMQLLGGTGRVHTEGISRAVYDMSGATTAKEFILRLAGLILALFLFRSALSAVFQYWQFGVITRGEGRLAARVFRLYMQAPYTFALQRHSAELLRNLQVSVEGFYSSVVLGCFYLVTEICLVVGIATALFVVEPLITLSGFIFLGICSLGFFLAVGRWSTRIGEQSQHLAKVTLKNMQDAIGGYKPLRVLRTTSLFVDRYTASRLRLAGVRQSGLFVSQLPRYYLETMLIVLVMVLCIVLLSTRSGTDVLAGLGLFIAGSFRMLPSLVRILQSHSSIKMGRAATSILKKELDVLAKPALASVSGTNTTFQDRLDFNSVTFTYPGSSEPALRNITLALRRGESVGLVGPSGAGKTTLVDVLLGLLRPDEGHILIDGKRLTDEQIPAWQRRIGYVPQDIYLIDDPLRCNIALGWEDDEIDEARVIEAVTLACLDDFVASLPDGLDTSVGERGVRLSGGQRQRIGIARALYTNPDILVLDEATSSLDTMTEASIVRTIEALRGNLTMVIVAHRLRTVQRCDCLYFLQHGRVAGQGTFAELRSTNAAFASLVVHADLNAGILPDARPAPSARPQVHHASLPPLGV